MGGRRVLAFEALVVIACSQGSFPSTAGGPEPGAMRCATDAQCPPAHPHCAPAPTPDRPVFKEDEPVLCPTGESCQSDSDCRDGKRCGIYLQSCCGGCSTFGCDDGYVCNADDVCTPLLCNEPGGLACPEHWRCDPELVAKEPYSAEGAMSDPLLAPDDWYAVHGCRLNRCNQPDGVLCKDLWRCDPPDAVDESGCVPLPCSDTGHCSNDAQYTCTPTNSAPRALGPDPHGCVFKNCGEAPSLFCSVFEKCEEGICRPLTCAELTCAAPSQCQQTDYGAECTSASGGQSSSLSGVCQ